MPETAYISLVIIIANFIISYKGFKNTAFFEGNLFQVEKILVNKEYKRLIISGFLHNGWKHLILNMFSLYLFSGMAEAYLGSISFLIVYFAALLGGNLLALFIHRHHSDYSAVGASGAVCGIIFASIALFPGMEIGLFFLPIRLPAWLYGLAYVLFTIYGIGSQKDNIGHEAHLGGALAGAIAAIIIRPSSLAENYITILIITLPCIAFIYLVATRPHLLLLGNPFARKKKPALTIDQQYNTSKANFQKEIDAILEKIHQKGMNSLSKSEREKLEIYSRQ